MNLSAVSYFYNERRRENVFGVLRKMTVHLKKKTVLDFKIQKNASIY